MFCVILHGHPTGQIFRVASSSRPGLLHVSLTTGRGDFIGYARDIAEAASLIARRFGDWSH